jgi:hypothetical protein
VESAGIEVGIMTTLGHEEVEKNTEIGKKYRNVKILIMKNHIVTTVQRVSIFGVRPCNLVRGYQGLQKYVLFEPCICPRDTFPLIFGNFLRMRTAQNLKRK